MAEGNAALALMVRKRRRGSSVLILAGLVAFAGLIIPSGPSTRVSAFIAHPHAGAFVPKDAAILAVAMMGVCTYMCMTEVAEKPPKQVPIEQRPDYIGVLVMSAFLSLLSGMVNAMAILDMGMTVAHHTGNASHVGRLLGENAGRFFMLMVAFWFGAGVVGFSKSDGEAVYTRRYSPGMLAASIAVASGCLIRWAGGDEPIAVNSTLVLWSYSQGIQNGITRKCSSLPVCTTHMTGYLTDFGSGLGLAFKSVRTGDVPNLKKPFFFGLSIFTFGAGGYAMKLARPDYGAQAVLAPAVLMAAVAFGLVPLVASGSSKVA